MAFPVALAVGVLDLFKMIFAKKQKVNDAVDWLIKAGVNLEHLKAARASIDRAADNIAAGRPEELVLPAEQVVALDMALDALSKAGDVVGKIF